MVEELLESLVGQVNAQLLEGVEIEDLESGDIEDTTEVLSGFLGIESSVTLSDQPLEDTLEDGLAQSFAGEVYLEKMVFRNIAWHILVQYDLFERRRTI